MLYFDNASTTFPKFQDVYEKAMEIYKNIGINFTRNKSIQSNLLENINKNLIDNLKNIYCSRDHEVILNSSATFSLNEIINGLDYSNIKTIYISPFEHNSVYRVLNKIQKIKNIDIEILKFNGYDLDFENMRIKFLSKKPDVIICNHSSNVFGNILPIEKIFQEGKKYSAITIVDSAQSGGILDFEKITPLSDFIVFAGHKGFYGPSGIGGYLYNKKISLEPLLYGGTGIKSEDLDMPEDLPERFQAGSPNTLGIIGLKMATDKILEIGMEEIRRVKNENFQKLYEILEEFDYDLEIISPRDNNVGIISVIGKDYSIKDLEKIFEQEEVVVRGGMHCAPLAHHQMKTNNGGTIRFSVGYFNKNEDFEELKKILEQVM
ncbi:aminotransferase class V-fold PLP-dependent enzyme [Cetobacterium sp. SF1]|uniref:aminotransferase class V-fold PLP-dependent enzyme n=1 Tax=Cetobacterium sp. SF1 TaxID=3417654 RepID=UPI003CE8010B